MNANTLLIIFLAILFTRTLDILEIGFLFLLRALGIIWFDYDWYKSFHEWYERVNERMKEKERKKKEEYEEASKELLIISDDPDPEEEIEEEEDITPYWAHDKNPYWPPEGEDRS